MTGLAALSGLAKGVAFGKSYRDDLEKRKADRARANEPMTSGGETYNPAAGGLGPSAAQGTAAAWTGGGRAPARGDGGGDGTLMGLIDATEGGASYDTLFAYSNNGGKFDGMRVSQKTLGELYEFTDTSGEYGQWVKGKVGRVATPMGRYQIVGTTLRNTAREMGLPDDTVFSPKVQDQMFRHLANRRLAGAKTPEAKRSAMRAEWEGFKHVSDAALDRAIRSYETGAEAPPEKEREQATPAAMGLPKSAAPQSEPPQTTQLGPTKVSAAALNGISGQSEQPQRWRWIDQVLEGM